MSGDLRYLLAIDPGNVQSAYVLVESSTLKPVQFGIVPNAELLKICKLNLFDDLRYDRMVIEMVASYGMPVGATVFDTCVWIGRFLQAGTEYLWPNPEPQLRFRADVKMHLCGQMRAKDGNIRQALIDRFGEVGTKKNPGFFYGFKADVWQAYALAVTHIETSAQTKEDK